MRTPRILVWLLFFLVPCTAQAAIQFRAATKHVSETMPLTAGKPAGTTDGDLLVALAIHDTEPACPCTPPAGQGWTAFSLPGSETDLTSRAWYKQVDASDAARTDYTFTFAGGDNSAILYLAAFYEDTGIGNWTLEDGAGFAFVDPANSISNGGVTAVNDSLFVVAYGNDDAEVVTSDPVGPTKIHEDMAAGAAMAAYFEMVDAIDGSVSYSITWGGISDQLSAMAGIFSWAPPPATWDISGTVYEDVDFVGVASDWDGGTTDVALDNVDVELYDAGDDSFVNSVTTGGGGVYTFTSVPDGAYKVRVRSASIGDADTLPASGLNASVPGTWPYPLAEMIWGGGAALVGGQSATTDDTATSDDAGPGDTWVAVSISGATAAGVNFGFVYNLIVNTDDDLQADEDRSKQGSLRQFIKNANAIGSAGGTTAKASEFRIPGGGPHTIQPVAQLPSIATTMTLDATSQPGWISTPVVEIDGSSAGASVDGLTITGDGSTIRGLAINRFGEDGVEFAPSASGNFLFGNHVGLDPSGLIDRGNTARGILMTSGSGPNTVGGALDTERNVISGNGGDGILVWESDGNFILGNYIGTDVTGNAPEPNGADGVNLANTSSNNTVGQPGAGNVLSGNGNDGLELDNDLSGNIVQANIIGLGEDGDTLVPNGRFGLVIYDGVNTTQVGGTDPGEGNVISGNTLEGVHINGNGVAATAGNVLEGNLIGTDQTGTVSRANGSHGVNIFGGANNNTIGGTDPASRNVISGNDDAGIMIAGEDSDGNRIYGNRIGINAAGTAQLANGADGITISGGADDTLIGGTGADDGNWISAPGGDGIEITGSSSGTVVLGNRIGTDVPGTANWGSKFAGMNIELGAFDTTIGSTAPGGANVIAFAGQGSAVNPNGVALQPDAGQGIKISGNAIYANEGLGIDLGFDGVTTNDSGDGDPGPNTTLNFPVLEAADIFGANLVLTGWARPDSLIELFLSDSDTSGFGQGETYLLTLTEGGTGAGGEDPYVDLDDTTSSYGTAAVNGHLQGEDTTERFRFVFPKPGSVSDGTILTATARDASNNTSEFSGQVTAQFATTNFIAGTAFEDVNYGGGAGRNLATATAAAPTFTVARPGAVVELYDAGGAFLETTTTDASGEYGFAGLVDGSYQVRVVNETVDSSRPDATTSEWPVQTFRTDASSGTAQPVVDEVGGASPADQDAAENTPPEVNLSTITAQSVAPVQITSGIAVSDVDFGFNFDTIVNTNDTGQGSLDRFIRNANVLGNANLAQVGRPAAIESAIFMLADGTARPGLRASYPSQFSGGVATIAPDAALPAVTDPAVLDATLQPGYVDRPIVVLDGTDAGVNVDGIQVSSGSSTVRGFVIHSFNGSGIQLDTNGGNTIEGNWLGVDATGSNPAPNNVEGLFISDVPNNVIGGTDPEDGNVMSGNRLRGLLIQGINATGNRVEGNYVGTDATGMSEVDNDIGIYLFNAPGNFIGGTAAGSGNLISGNDIYGVYLVGTNTTGTLVQGNTIGLNSDGSGTLGNVLAGVEISSAIGNTIGGTDPGAGNVITGGAVGVGLVVGSQIEISRNSIYGNDGPSIDLNNDGVTPNDGATGAGPNMFQDYPVLTSARLIGTTLTVEGYVGTAALKIPGPHTIEVFKADDDGNNDGEVELGDGLNVGHGEGRWYVDSCASAVDGTFDCTLSVPGGVSLTVGDPITATATDGSGNSSEMAANVPVPPPLAILKRAFQSDGTPFASGNMPPRGIPVKFVLYIDNPDGAVDDVTVQDVLDPVFDYVTGSIKVDNTLVSSVVCPAGVCDEAAIFTQVDSSGSTLGDGDADADEGSYTAGTKTIDLGDGNNLNNAQLDIAANRVWAVVFTVRML